jgi:hypothetical protein
MTVNFKGQAKRLRAFLSEKHHFELPLSAALEAIATIHGAKNWDTLMGMDKSSVPSHPQSKVESVAKRPLDGDAHALAHMFLMAFTKKNTPDERVSFWTNRAVSRLALPILLALTELRDRNNAPFSVDTIRTWLPFEKFCILRNNPSISEATRNELDETLTNLPTYSAEAETQSIACIEQYGYLQMHFAQMLDDWAKIEASSPQGSTACGVPFNGLQSKLDEI